MPIPKIAIVGDLNPASVSQQLLNRSLDWLKERNAFQYEWLETARIVPGGPDVLGPYCGVWSAPGSPFRSLEGALEAIRYARENNVPHLGTCGGMQHTLLEFARNVLGISGAQHEEYDSASPELFITRLACSLSGRTMRVKIEKGSLAFKCYQGNETIEDYRCHFGINPKYRERLSRSSLKVTGVDQDNEIRIVEIPKNDFFLATLFVPQTRATRERPHPIIKAFVEACLERSQA